MNWQMHLCNCNYDYHPIYYVNKNDYTAITQYFKKFSDSTYREFFIKEKDTYSLQNEWRFLIHDIDSCFVINQKGGVDIKTGFRSEMPILESDQLRRFKIHKEYVL